MDPQVVDPCSGDGHGPPVEVGDTGARHPEVGQRSMDGLQDQPGCLTQHCRGDPPVEHEVVVLVDRNPRHDLVGHRAVGLHPGVPVADPGGQLLGRRVGEYLYRTRRSVAPPLRHGGQPFVLQLRRITVTAGEQVVPDGDGVLTLLGRPEAGPLGHRRILGEAPGDLGVVVGQVVLGQQVQLERRPHLWGEGGLGLVPRLVPKTATLLPRHDLVGVPVLPPLPVLAHEPGDLRLDGRDQLQRFGSGGHSAPIPRPGIRDRLRPPGEPGTLEGRSRPISRRWPARARRRSCSDGTR